MRLLIILFLLLPLCGCGSTIAFFGYDNRKDIAMATLFSRDEPSENFLSLQQFDEETFAAALLAKFPAGSSSSYLEEFTKKLGGECEHQNANEIGCWIPESGGFCYVTSIVVTVELTDGKIKSIGTIRQGGGC